MSSRCIFGCSPQERSKITHCFPSPNIYPVLYQKWLELVPSRFKNENCHRKYRVCDRHFKPEAKYGKSRLQRWAVPKLHLPSEPTTVDTHFPCAESLSIDLPTLRNQVVDDAGCVLQNPIEVEVASSTWGGLIHEESIPYVGEIYCASESIVQPLYGTVELEDSNNCELLQLSVWKIKELIKYEHSYATHRNSNGELQKEDTIIIVDDTLVNTNGNGGNTTKVDLTKLIESYNIEETCYSDAEQLLSHLDVAEVTEIATIADNKENIASQDQNEIREPLQKSEDIISNCNLSSCDDLLSNKEECQNKNKKNSVSTATTKYTKNIKTTEIQHVLDDANVNKVNESSAGYKRKRKYIFYPIQPKSGRSAIISKREISEITTKRNDCALKAYICFDENSLSKMSQPEVNKIKPLLRNSISFFNTQNNSPYKQSVPSAFVDFAPFKCRDKVLNASLLLNLENKDPNSLKFGGYNANNLNQLDGKNSLQRSGCNINVNLIREESIREICEQAKSEYRSIPNDELCLSDNYTQNNAIIQDSLSINPDRHIISESKSIPNNELCLSDIHTLDNGIQRPLCTSTNRHVSVRISEENCVSPAGPVSPKPEKLYVSELDQYVGSTTFVSGGFEPNDDEPVEDPLAIHSPDLGIKDSGALNEDSMTCSVENNMNVVEDHNVSNVEDNISNVEGNISDVEDNISIIKDNMSNAEDNISNVEGNISDVDDDMSIIKDNMSKAEDNISNVEGNISDVEDNMSNAEDNISNVEGNLSDVEDNTSIVENMSTEKDNMSYKKDTRHLVDRLDSFNPDSKHCIDDFVHREECNDDLDLRLEIAFALKFMYKKDKTPKEAVEEIIETYGKGKLTLKEAKCWYHEFELGNNIMRIISSGGPVYK